MKQLLCSVIFLIASLIPLKAQYRDSCRAGEMSAKMKSAESFRPRVLAGTGLLFTAGALGVNWSLYDVNINTPAKTSADALRAKYGAFHADDWLQYLPSAAYLGLGAFNQGKHRFVEHAAVCATAWSIMGISVNALKYSFADLRPDGSTRNSFPSGHTATAFMGAELLRLEYGGWWGAGAYAVAGTVAVLRVYNGRHWVNDLLGGAAIGILSANAAYWLLPLERRLFGIKGREEAALAILPYLGPQGSAGISIECGF